MLQKYLANNHTTSDQVHKELKPTKIPLKLASREDLKTTSKLPISHNKKSSVKVPSLPVKSPSTKQKHLNADRSKKPRQPHADREPRFEGANKNRNSLDYLEDTCDDKESRRFKTDSSNSSDDEQLIHMNR